MNDAPQLIDRAALQMHRSRPAQTPALFLHDLAREEAQDRLEMVNKSFQEPVIITPQPQIWQGMIPGAICRDDEDVLDLQESSQDLAIHALCLHWANDPVGQLIQCRRALRPDGLFLGFTLGGQTLHELRAALGQAEIEVTGGLSPRVLPMGEIRDMGALMQRAGFALPVVDSHCQTVSYQTLFHLMKDLRAMGETNALSTRAKHLTRRSILTRAAELYARTFSTDDGRITASFEIITMTGWAPDASQPQPLRPGSATNRLADVLGTMETPLKD